MGRYILAISAGFFCACTVLMGGYLVLQMQSHKTNSPKYARHLVNQPDDLAFEQPGMTTRSLSTQRDASSSNTFRLATATTVLPLAAIEKIEVEWPNGQKATLGKHSRL